VTTKNEVYTDPIGVKNRLWPLRCLQRKFLFFYLIVLGSINWFWLFLEVVFH
jgi:hypothetical protein